MKKVIKSGKLKAVSGGNGKMCGYSGVKAAKAKGGSGTTGGKMAGFTGARPATPR